MIVLKIVNTLMLPVSDHARRKIGCPGVGARAHMRTPFPDLGTAGPIGFKFGMCLDVH